MNNQQCVHIVGVCYPETSCFDASASLGKQLNSSARLDLFIINAWLNKILISLALYVLFFKRTEIEPSTIRQEKKVQRFLLIKGIYSSMLERTTEMNFCFVVPNGKESLHSNAAEF
jgi:hypothetical protein